MCVFKWGLIRNNDSGDFILIIKHKTCTEKSCIFIRERVWDELIGANVTEELVCDNENKNLRSSDKGILLYWFKRNQRRIRRIKQNTIEKKGMYNIINNIIANAEKCYNGLEIIIVGLLFFYNKQVKIVLYAWSIILKLY